MHLMSMIFLAVITASALAGLGTFAGLYEWGFWQLRWRNLTVHNCQRYLVRNGWTYVGLHFAAARLDKGEFRILIDCTLCDPATLGSVQSLVGGYTIQNRQVVIFTIGAIEPGVVDLMLSRNVIVMPYKQLYNFDRILRQHEEALKNFRLRHKQLLTEALSPPMPAKLLPVAPEPVAPEPPPHVAEVVDRLIAETQHVQCFLRDQGAQTLVIAFNESVRFGAAGRLQPRIDMAGLGFSILDFVTREPNWFPADDMAALVPAALRQIGNRFPRIVCFGIGQGGYGAIKFSRALGATTTIALSPQFSIDPRVVEGSRFGSHFRSHLNVGMAIATKDCVCPTYVFYDPHDKQDSQDVALIGQQIGIVEIPLRFVGPGAGQLFATRESLQRLVALCQAADINGLIRLAADLRHTNRGRSYLMAMDLAQSKPGMALRIANTHASTWGIARQPNFWYRLATNGRAGEALERMQQLAAAHPQDDEISGCAALVALQAQQIPAAIGFANKACELNPASARWRHVQTRARKLQLEMHG